jgi:hypothetical protein
MNSGPENIEPNELADRYEATKNLYVFLKQIIESFGELNEDGDEPIPEYYRQVKQIYESLGPAQMHRNHFSMEEYREVHGDLPTLETSTPSGKERAVLSGIGVIDRNDEPLLPVNEDGERLPILVSSTDEVQKAIETLEEYRQYISEVSVKILHVADTHLGYAHRSTYKSKGYTPNHEVDCLGAFEEVIDVAKRNEVDAVVHAGDVFDHYVEEEDIDSFRQHISDLRRNEISFHFVIGDHDGLSATYGGENAVSELFEMARKEDIDLLDGEPSVLGGGIVALYGVGHVGLGVEDWNHSTDEWRYDGWDESWWDNPGLSFVEEPNTEHSVLCSHGKFSEDGNMPASEVVENSNFWFDKLLLGDRHIPVDDVGGYIDAHYAGPTQRISRSKKDIEPRVNIFEFHESGEIEHEEVSIA